jgi:hypothetical protein
VFESYHALKEQNKKIMTVKRINCLSLKGKSVSPVNARSSATVKRRLNDQNSIPEVMTSILFYL